MVADRKNSYISKEMNDLISFEKSFIIWKNFIIFP